MSTAIPSFSSKPKITREYKLIEDGDYPARVTRFAGLGVHPQPPFQGQEKDPAFKAMFEFELIGIDTSGFEVTDAGLDSEVRVALDPAPSCQFHDVFLFPNAGRGKVFELCQVLDATIMKVPKDLEWFEQHLGAIVNVKVGRYTIMKGDNAGKERNTVKGVSAVPSMFKSQVGEARRDKIFFNPYVETDQAFAAYSSLFHFQRGMLVDAIDSQHIIYSGMEPAREDKGAQASKEASKKSAAEVGVEDCDVPFSPVGLQHNNSLMHVI
jgi:hypothetical protein